MNTQTIVLFITGLVLLLIGAELLVRGASRLATTIGMSPLVVGLVVVSFCTTSPELAVSASSALAGEADLALGNVAGSTIFNILFIIGLSAMLAPLVVKLQLIRLDVPIALAAAVVVWLMSLNGGIDRLDGMLLFAGIVAYVIFLIVQARREKDADALAQFDTEYGQPPARDRRQLIVYLLLIVGGLAMLVIGSNWMVDGAVSLARLFGVDDVLIGLTIIAAGTSLPEIMTAVMATRRGERDIAVGNVVDRTINQQLAVLALKVLIERDGVPVPPYVLRLGLPVMIGVIALCIPMFYLGMNVSRKEGVMLFGFYIGITGFFILSGINHPAADVVGIVVAAVGVTVLAAFFVLAWSQRQATKQRLQT